jgi:hypothetical protein
MLTSRSIPWSGFTERIAQSTGKRHNLPNTYQYQTRFSGYCEEPFRLPVPAQPVDATPSNALTRQCFLGRSDLLG